MAGWDIRRTRIDIFAIHLVGEEVQVVLLHQVSNLVHFPACVKIACRIVGVTDHDGARTLINQFLKFLHLRQRETFLDSGGDGTNLCARRNGKGHIVGVGRLWHDNLVARVQAWQEREKHSFRTTRCNDDVVGCYLNIILGVIVYEFLAIAQITLRWWILQDVTVYLLQGIQSYLWCWQVWLSDVQMIHLRTSFLCCGSKRGEFSYWWLGHLKAANWYLRHLTYLWFTDLRFYYFGCKGTKIFLKRAFFRFICLLLQRIFCLQDSNCK